MKRILFFWLTSCCIALSQGQIPSYYSDVNLNLNGQDLKDELSDKITRTHTTDLSYTPGVWDALKQTDLDPSNSNKVVLIYGYNDSDGDRTNDRTRGVNENGGGSTDWNREHVYPKSLGNPNLGTSGPGADAHHLRPADVQWNSNRGSRKFAEGSGNSGVTSQGYWYPGDEFKGDVARMMMYVYLRYGSRCLPSNVGIGTSITSDTGMIDLFLIWNAEDPVSALELQRNPILENLQGNRNPFIDNPAFATEIWGGPQAEDRFGNSGGGNSSCDNTISQLPYSQSFENTFGYWKQAVSQDDFNWSLNSGSTPSSNTGPSSANNGSYYAYMESSSPNYSNKRAILYGPCIDLPSSSQIAFDFNYHMYGASSMGSLALEISLNGNDWNQIWSKSGNQGNSWLNASVDLSSYTGNSVQLRFNGLTGTTWQGDIAIDGLALTTGATGGGNSNQAIVLDIAFDNYPEETSWEIRNSNTNQLIYSGGTYGEQADNSTITVSGDLSEGCYNLIFYDSYGDGICCSYGNGSFELRLENTNTVLVSGGSFGSSIVQEFCIGSTTRDFQDTTINTLRKTNLINDLLIYPNPAKDIISLKATFPEDATLQITTVSGKVVFNGSWSKSIDISNLTSGIYFVKVITGQDQYITKFQKY